MKRLFNSRFPLKDFLKNERNSLYFGLFLYFFSFPKKVTKKVSPWKTYYPLTVLFPKTFKLLLVPRRQTLKVFTKISQSGTQSWFSYERPKKLNPLTKSGVLPKYNFPLRYKHFFLINGMIFLFLLFPFGILAQDYIFYHQEINKAERAILDSNYQEAVVIYDQLFKKFENVYAKNCITATQTAIFAQDFEKAFQFLERSWKQGVKLEYCSQDSVFVELKNYSSWEKSASKYDSLHQIYNSKIDTEYRGKINKMMELDQIWRDKHEEHPWNFLWRPFIWMKWKKVTQKIIEEELVPLIKEKGFPGEFLIGLDEKGSYYKQTRNSNGTNYAWLIFIHYYSVPRDLDFVELCKEEVKKGNLSPYHFASIMDFQAQWGKKKYYNGIFYNEWHSTKEESQFPEIEKLRADIGLDSLAEHKEKVSRGLEICRLRKEGNYKHIVFFRAWCG